jgi:hypothetical protein
MSSDITFFSAVAAASFLAGQVALEGARDALIEQDAHGRSASPWPIPARRWPVPY